MIALTILIVLAIAAAYIILNDYLKDVKQINEYYENQSNVRPPHGGNEG